MKIISNPVWNSTNKIKSEKHIIHEFLCLWKQTMKIIDEWTSKHKKKRTLNHLSRALFDFLSNLIEILHSSGIGIICGWWEDCVVVGIFCFVIQVQHYRTSGWNSILLVLQNLYVTCGSLAVGANVALTPNFIFLPFRLPNYHDPTILGIFVCKSGSAQPPWLKSPSLQWERSSIKCNSIS